MIEIALFFFYEMFDDDFPSAKVKGKNTFYFLDLTA